ncbi:hypothetical protein ANRL4_03783 [Anaerolineae bacterium]|nr:hypothetical protein ANRL4_03783 [Anaerolineae bacterium]
MNRGFLQSTSNLVTCLLQTPPAELLGLALLRQSTPAPGGWFPTDVPLAQVKQAAVEFIHYGGRCREAAHTLTALRPVPLLVSCPEFGL